MNPWANGGVARDWVWAGWCGLDNLSLPGRGALGPRWEVPFRCQAREEGERASDWEELRARGRPPASIGLGVGLRRPCKRAANPADPENLGRLQSRRGFVQRETTQAVQVRHARPRRPRDDAGRDDAGMVAPPRPDGWAPKHDPLQTEAKATRNRNSRCSTWGLQGRLHAQVAMQPVNMQKLKCFGEKSSPSVPPSASPPPRSHAQLGT